MDSENEVIIVDDIIATNGLNGHSEDLNEMKTRSKASEVDAMKAKMRSSVRSSAGGQDKAGSDTEMKKDSSKKVVEGKPAAAAAGVAIATATKSTSSSSSTTTSLDTSAKMSNANVSTTKKGTKANDELPQPQQQQQQQQQPIVLLPAKKRNLDREDDSGINSRASSVSNLDDVTPRMRTRSSRNSDMMASTSTPAGKRNSQGRMPLSSYDFEDVTFDEDVSSPGSLKRKAVLYVEEMDDGDEVEKQQESEPVAKRPALTMTTNFFNAFLNPLRALRGRFGLSKQPVNNVETEAPTATVATTTEATETTSSTKAAKANAEDTIKENVSQSAETSNDLSESTNASQTCRIM